MGAKRFSKIIAAVPKCQTLADVGCDHGYVGIAALEKGLANFVVFSDISAESLRKAKVNCPTDFRDNAKFVCQDGLGDEVVDCAVIAGMGGLETISVLTKAKHLPQTLVLQPMRNQTDVRKYLQTDYKIIFDQKFCDEKYYDLIVAEKCAGGSALSDDEIQFGLTNLTEPTTDFVDFLDAEIAKYQQILTRCNDLAVANILAKTLAVAKRIREEQQ